MTTIGAGLRASQEVHGSIIGRIRLFQISYGAAEEKNLLSDHEPHSLRAAEAFFGDVAERPAFCAPTCGGRLYAS